PSGRCNSTWGKTRGNAWGTREAREPRSWAGRDDRTAMLANPHRLTPTTGGASLFAAFPAARSEHARVLLLTIPGRRWSGEEWMCIRDRLELGCAIDSRTGSAHNPAPLRAPRDWGRRPDFRWRGLMPATRTYLVGLVIFALSHGVAAGSPIQVYLHGYVDGHLVDQTVPLGDPSQPFSIPIASTHLTASSGPNPSHRSRP